MGKSINSETRGASIKKIVPTPDVNKGLAIATFTDVDLGEAKIKEDSAWVDFRGLSVPRITFVFTEKIATKDKEQGMYFKSYTAFPDVFDADKQWQWDSLAQTVKHFIDILSENKFLDQYADLLNLNIDESGSTSVEDQLKAWKTFFEGIVKVFKGDKKAGLPTLIGKEIWLKLILDIKGIKVNSGDFGLPGYPGDGIIELYKEGVNPSIRVNISKGENIIPREYAEPTLLGVKSASAPAGNKPSFMT